MKLSRRFAAGKTLSWGTVRIPDLLEEIMDFWEELPEEEMARLDEEFIEAMNELVDEVPTAIYRIEEQGISPDEDELFLLDGLMVMLNDIAPVDCQFGNDFDDRMRFAFIDENLNILMEQCLIELVLKQFTISYYLYF
ncbi:hypothetical protein [Halarsenatibacter silvermanii]|uniref:Uncharacterized protein n=1 Tax=Halarsenatibacter silvermanii TaxID=321763 RepID=A0A1G9RAH1_9FIRM|nr:hypothetical protein [Halarsenatibacter silvermanii]SDM20100.1 hypothetical protein SAMN04488692_12114 [Halarsenatibacter silvermanii]